jgi:pilus assembly protein CpaE
MNSMNKGTGAVNGGGAGVLVPRISIAAFCAQSETLSVMQSAAGDRRLSKTHVSVQLEGIAGAITHFAHQASPDLLIVETQNEGDAVFAELDQLANVCGDKTKVMVIGRANDIRLYRELARFRP